MHWFPHGFSVVSGAGLTFGCLPHGPAFFYLHCDFAVFVLCSHSVPQMGPSGLVCFCHLVWEAVFSQVGEGKEGTSGAGTPSEQSRLTLAVGEGSKCGVDAHFPFNLHPLGNEKSHLQEHRHARLLYAPVSSRGDRSCP